MLITGAAAQIPGDGIADFRLAGIRIRLQQLHGAKDHSRSTVAALQSMTLPETLLHRVKRSAAIRSTVALATAVFPCRGKPFNGGDHAAARLHGEHRARLDRPAIEQDCAGSANGGLAADVCARQAQSLAEVMDQQQPRLDFVVIRLPIDLQLNLDGHKAPILGIRRAFAVDRPAADELYIKRKAPVEERHVTPCRAKFQVCEILTREMEGKGNYASKRRTQMRLEAGAPR